MQGRGTHVGVCLSLSLSQPKNNIQHLAVAHFFPSPHKQGDFLKAMQRVGVGACGRVGVWVCGREDGRSHHNTCSFLCVFSIFMYMSSSVS